MPVRAVGIRNLKNRLSEYVRLAASGETILVTDRDRVVAELCPPREGRSPMVRDALLAEMVRTGVVTPPTIPPGAPVPRKPVTGFDELMRELAADREDR